MIERSQFRNTIFSENSSLPWTCSRCLKGHLKLNQENFKIWTSVDSKDLMDEIGDPDCLEYRYSGTFECTNETCRERYASMGTGRIETDVEFELDEPSAHYVSYFLPKFIYPHPKFIEIPNTTPDLIKNTLKLSFELFFYDPSSSANHVRKTIENILNYLKVKSFEVRGGKRRRISTHARIMLLPQPYLKHKDFLLALKWIGNAGSHSTIAPDDVLDAYEILEVILNEMFSDERNRINSIVKTINRTGTPQSKKKKKGKYGVESFTI